jgi:predicted ABC-type transport system involved in lysophospholipase L1 biosynthesis ATPase subunit
MTSNPVAVCDSVSRSFGDVHAVHNVCCSLGAGQRVVIVGPSGSGKSTLLHIIAGIEEPSSGSVSWPALGLRDQLRPRLVALIFQSPSLLAPLDVLENVALPLVLAGVDSDDARRAAHQALSRLGLDDLAGRLPEELSGGQAQRVAVARVIAGRPRLVIADEPTGQLDHHTGSRMLDVLDAAVADVGAALLLSTHDRRVAARFDRRWTMGDGRLAVAAA